MTDFDLVIIGGGSGGVALARRAALRGARVAVCEEDRYGGTCVHRGCVPKKLLMYGAGFADEFRSAAGYGWTVGQPSFDWASLIAAKDRELERLNGYYNRTLEEGGIRRVNARARVVDGHTVEAAGERLTARYLVMAVGSWPRRPNIPGIDLAITSNEAFHLRQLPRRVVVSGSGYIGVEFASIFHGLGSEVTMVFGSDLVLPDFDQDVRSTLQDELTKRGIRIAGGARLEAIEKSGDGLVANGVLCDAVLNATGRVPNTHGIGLEEAGVELSKSGAIVVDHDLRTGVDSIYALGDCIGRVQLTPVAIAEGRALAERLFGQGAPALDYANVPTAVFTAPPVGVVGMTESEARCRGPVKIFRTRFRPMKHSLTGKDEKVMLKLVVDADSDRVLGCHMVGPDAPEIIQALAVAITCQATKAQFDRTVALHPSLAEEFVTMREPVAS